MNTAEKIAATYLRLNGFLLLPHFTVFEGGNHCHVDLIGLRAARSVEVANERELVVDEQFFDAVAQLISLPKESYLGVVAEVRTNENRPELRADRIDYVRRFLGETLIAPMRFYDSSGNPKVEGDVVCVDIRYAMCWILDHIRSMNEDHPRLTKDGSWTWSEESLSDILVLFRYGFLRSEPSA